MFDHQNHKLSFYLQIFYLIIQNSLLNKNYIFNLRSYLLALTERKICLNRFENILRENKQYIEIANMQFL